MSISSVKVGQVPLQRLHHEERAGHYEMTDSLYQSPHGYVWCRTVTDHTTEDYSPQRFTLVLTMVHQGRCYTRRTNRAECYTPLSQCRLARVFAREVVDSVKSAPAHA